MANNDLFSESKRERVTSPEQLNRYMKVVTPGVGIVIATLIVIAIGALCWGIYGSIPVTVDLGGAFTRVSDGVYDSFIVVADATTDAQIIERGMEAQVSPSHAPRDEYGYIIGQVSDISTFPVSHDAVADLLGSAEMAELIMTEEPGRLVTIRFERDPSSQNGLVWSNDRGKQVEINAGTLATALIIVREQRPIDLVLEGEK